MKNQVLEIKIMLQMVKIFIENAENKRLILLKRK